MEKLQILKIDDIVCNILSKYPAKTVLQYKNLSIYIVNDYSIDIKTPNYKASAGTKALSNRYLLYNENKETFLIIHQLDYETIKDNIYDFKYINFNDFSIPAYL